jgi:hypothetical protein
MFFLRTRRRSVRHFIKLENEESYNQCYKSKGTNRPTTPPVAALRKLPTQHLSHSHAYTNSTKTTREAPRPAP